jgi:hypothetical protein
VDIEDLLDEALIGVQRCVEEDERKGSRERRRRSERKLREAFTKKP